MVIKIAVNDESEIKKERKREIQRRYYERNKEKVKESQKRYYERNKEKMKEYHKQYSERNKEKIKERQRQYMREHKAQQRDSNHRYYVKHSEERKEYTKKYYDENKADINRYRRGERPAKRPNSLRRPIGSERVDKHGCIIVKIGEDNKWRLKHHIVYEDYYGDKVEKLDRIIFLDGNKRNFDPKNLAKVSPEEQMFLMGSKMLCNDTEINKTSVNLSKLIFTTRKLEK